MKQITSLPITRISRHSILWLVVWLFFRYVNYGLYIHDNTQVINSLSIVTFGQTFLLFYLFGYRVFPRYLYSFRFLPFSLFVLLAYYFVYLSSYLAIYYLQRISSDNGPEPLIAGTTNVDLNSASGIIGLLHKHGGGFLDDKQQFFLRHADSGR